MGAFISGAFGVLATMPWWALMIMVVFDLVVAFILMRFVVDNPKVWPQLRFRLIFGVGPHARWNYTKREMTQPVVDQRLKERAQKLAAADKKKSAATAQRTSDTKVARANMRAVDHAYNASWRAEKRFNYARDIARMLGYRVRDAIDYK